MALTRQTLIETALRLLDDVGLDGLTVRRLAGELGVQSPALYWHIRTKQELLDGMADAIVLAGGMGPPRDGEGWREWLGRRARGYRGALLAHRDGARVITMAASLGPGTIRQFDEELTALVGCGFTPVLALRTLASCTSYVNGFVLREQAERGAVTSVAEIAGLLEGGMESTLLRAIREGGGTMGEEAFEHGLRLLIDGTAVALG
ncbi:TetR/AcrR family transcriptional regulator C-terminal domain-containing protein [Nonomuraea sp. NPDC050663]|uniref:TetR/AcrR family transcriptional regulator C-terminal domain-containing protein n=1 Tax=Nonomuraea sp. NPDC050663 TaxID=3364370 RepID=UPI0037A3A893